MKEFKLVTVNRAKEQKHRKKENVYIKANSAVININSVNVIVMSIADLLGYIILKGSLFLPILSSNERLLNFQKSLTKHCKLY